MANEQPPGAVPPPPAPAAHPANRPGGAGERVVVVQHSDLFYWWPVWLLGFLIAGITYWQDFHMAIVPNGTRAVEQRKIEIEPGKLEERDVLVLDAKHRLPTVTAPDGTTHPVQPRFFVSPYRSLGVVYVF